MFQLLTHVELSRSMAAILEMPQYVAYQKNVVNTFIKLRAKSHSFYILRTMVGLSCPTIIRVSNFKKQLSLKIMQYFFLYHVIGLYVHLLRRISVKMVQGY